MFPLMARRKQNITDIVGWIGVFPANGLGFGK
jgi:hypothetical protein